MYEQFGPEWEKEVLKNNKKQLVDLYKESAIKVLQLEEELKELKSKKSEDKITPILTPIKNLIDRSTPTNAFEVIMKIKSEIKKIEG